MVLILRTIVLVAERLIAGAGGNSVVARQPAIALPPSLADAPTALDPAEAGTGRAAIALWQNNVFDLNTIVQDVRLALDHAIERLRVAVRERARAAAVLAWLIDDRDRSESPSRRRRARQARGLDRRARSRGLPPYRSAHPTQQGPRRMRELLATFALSPLRR